MKISIITACLNSEGTIRDTLESIKSQSYDNFEHIVVDGKSGDRTLEIVDEYKKYFEIRIISEIDTGLYSAMNKGIRFASGEIICFLNSDDFYASDSVLRNVVDGFNYGNPDFVYGNIRMFSRESKIVRYWKTGDINKIPIIGKQIPHPAFFIKTEIICNLNAYFDESYKIAADLKQQLYVVYKFRRKGFYIDRLLVNMRLGGASTSCYSSYIKGWEESRRAYNEIFGFGGLIFVFFKVISKLKNYTHHF